MDEQLVNHHKIVQDAEIMTKGEFIQEHGEQYLEYYEQVQANVPSHLSKFLEECSSSTFEELMGWTDE
jgi:uncharacterized beta-barrel protein YwiB (DUF1934 family)